MGAPPELPDPSENELRPIEAAHIPPFSDDSDNEAMDHDGYEPLALDDFNEQDQVDIQEEEESNGAVIEPQIITQDPNLPAIESAEVEIERQVWNAPRPQETNIVLDEQRTAQILNAMANFTLPNITLPEWAADPEERWKDELLQRIRQRKETQEDVKGEQKT